MERVMWMPIRRMFCEKAGAAAALEVRLVYPAELLPDQPPRVVAHRCSLGLQCNQMESPTCCWAGTLPGFDPFRIRARDL
jgi:hypothetical protein